MLLLASDKILFLIWVKYGPVQWILFGKGKNEVCSSNTKTTPKETLKEVSLRTY